MDTPWDDPSPTKIWFKTQAAISASGSDDNYYLYYNYLSAGIPPADGNNVFLFYDGFESGDATAWNNGTWWGTGDSVTFPTTTVHTGTYAAQCSVDTQYPNQACVVHNFGAQTGISTTGWFYLPTDYSAVDYLAFTQLMNTSWANTAPKNIYEEPSDARVPYIYNVPGGGFYFSDTALTTGEWHRLEMRFLVSAASGRAELWVDGTRKVNRSTINTGTTDLMVVASGIFWRGDATAATIYFDDNFQRIWVDPEPFTGLSEEEFPTVVELISFTARSESNCVKVEWVTATELDNEGFNLWRRRMKDGEYMRINPYFIPAQGEAGFGAEYSYKDYDVQNGTIYYYKLEDIDIYGKGTFHGPVPAIPNDLTPIWPPDRKVLPSDAFLFRWSSSGSYSFKVEMFTHPSFPASENLSFPAWGWTSDSSLWLSPREWKLVLSKAYQSGGKLFWRVRARSEDGRVICSDWKKFMIDF